MRRNNDQSVKETKLVDHPDIANLHLAIHEICKSKEPIQIEQPCSNLQGLWLHSVEPFFNIDIAHRSILADLTYEHALRLCFTRWASQCG